MRFPFLKSTEMSAEQAALAQRYRSSWRNKLPADAEGALGGPLDAMIRAPELSSRISYLSDYFRELSTLDKKQVEFIVLLSARADSSDYEWSAHLPMAITAGVSEEAAAAIARGEKPESLSANESEIHDLVVTMFRRGRLSDDEFARAKEELGERTVVEVVALTGFYTMISRILAAANVGAPAGGAVLPPLA